MLIPVLDIKKRISENDSLVENKLTEDELFQKIAKELGLPFIKINASNIEKQILNILPEKIAKSKKTIIFDAMVFVSGIIIPAAIKSSKKPVINTTASGNGI